jgi:hypothetical protein
VKEDYFVIVSVAVVVRVSEPLTPVIVSVYVPVCPFDAVTVTVEEDVVDWGEKVAVALKGRPLTLS